jgi:hypothetical protein
MRILFIHGRAQGGEDPVALRDTWIETLEKGLTAANTSLPGDVSIDFPYYGDALDDFTEQAALPTPEDVVAKGPGQDRKFEQFMQSALDEMYQQSELTETQVEAEMDEHETALREKGPQNWRWVQAIARAIDRRFTRGSSWTINQFLRDVYLYVNVRAVTKGIDEIVEKEITDEPTIVVGHSLGSVVGYNVIRNNRDKLHVCKYVTIGCPLGIRAISTRLGVPENTALDGWYNAFDEGDIVALNPLNETFFPARPTIENFNEIQNGTDNQHGIVGYLNDARVASVIAEAARSHAV